MFVGSISKLLNYNWQITLAKSFILESLIRMIGFLNCGTLSISI